MASFILKEGMVYCEGDPNYYGLDNVILTPPKPAWYYDYDEKNNTWILSEENQAKQEALNKKGAILTAIRSTTDLEDELSLIHKAIEALSKSEALPKEYTDLRTVVENAKISFEEALAVSKLVQP